MKKLYLLLLIPLFFACSSDDKEVVKNELNGTSWIDFAGDINSYYMQSTLSFDSNSSLTWATKGNTEYLGIIDHKTYYTYSGDYPNITIVNSDKSKIYDIIVEGNTLIMYTPGTNTIMTEYARQN